MSNKKTHDSQSDEDNKTEGEREASITSTIIENNKEESSDVTDGIERDTKEPVSPDKSEILEVSIKIVSMKGCCVQPSRISCLCY